MINDRDVLIPVLLIGCLCYLGANVAVYTRDYD